jgi:hypothetical protein
MSDQTHAPQKASLLSNILAVIGFIILVVIIIWGLVHIADLSRGVFGSLFPKATPTIVVNGSADAPSGTPTTISWKYKPTTNGHFAFLYQCQNGVQFETLSASSTASALPCGAASPILPTATAEGASLRVIPFVTNTTNAKVPFSIIFIPTTGVKVQGNSTMTITPGAVLPKPIVQAPAPKPVKHTVIPPKPTNVVHHTPVVQPTRSYSPASLSVHIVAVGIIDPGTGAFVRQAPTENDTAAVQFDIANVGGRSTGTWYFTAELPTYPNAYTYNSPAQRSLAPGDHILNTLKFAPSSGGTFQVTTTGGKTASVNI